MEVDTILTIILVVVIAIGLISFFIWALCKNEKIAKFFKKISEWIGETISHSGI